MNKSLTNYLLPSFAVVAAILIGASSFGGPVAADKNVMPAPPPCNWSGFYIGMNVGVAGLHTNITDLDDWFDPFTNTIEDTNVAVGGQFGYNWQMGSFVFGIEADADYLNTERTHTDELDTGDAGHLQYKADVDFQGSVRARAGVAVDKALIYATGGVAFSHGSDRFTAEEGPNEGPPGFHATQDDWQAGFVGGVGAEYMINCHWSARLEALYYEYPESTGSFTLPGFDDEERARTFRFSFQNEDWNVRVGVNYKF